MEPDWSEKVTYELPKGSFTGAHVDWSAEPNGM